MVCFLLIAQAAGNPAGRHPAISGCMLTTLYGVAECGVTW